MRFVYSWAKDLVLLFCPQVTDHPTKQRYCQFHPGILLCFTCDNGWVIQNNKRFRRGCRHFVPISLLLFVCRFYHAICQLPSVHVKIQKLKVKMQKGRIAEEGFFEACSVGIQFNNACRLILFQGKS